MNMFDKLLARLHAAEIAATRRTRRKHAEPEHHPSRESLEHDGHNALAGAHHARSRSKHPSRLQAHAKHRKGHSR